MNGTPANAVPYALPTEAISPDDEMFCARACAFIRLGRSVPDFFRAYLAEWSADAGRADLAAKLRACTTESLAALHERLYDLQSQLR